MPLSKYPNLYKENKNYYLAYDVPDYSSFYPAGGDFCVFVFRGCSHVKSTVMYKVLLVKTSISLQISLVERQQAQIMAASADAEEFVS